MPATGAAASRPGNAYTPSTLMGVSSSAAGGAKAAAAAVVVMKPASSPWLPSWGTVGEDGTESGSPSLTSFVVEVASCAVVLLLVWGVVGDVGWADVVGKEEEGRRSSSLYEWIHLYI